MNFLHGGKEAFGGHESWIVSIVLRFATAQKKKIALLAKNLNSRR